MKKQNGFSLIELLIVVVIIGIVAALAIPNLLSSRRSANEGSAVSSIRVIHGAQMTYAATYGSGNYAPDLTALGMVTLTDQQLSAGLKSGYSFETASEDATATTEAIFAIAATPTTTTGLAQTGTRNFACDQSGAIHYSYDFSWGITNASLDSGGIAFPNN